MEKKIVASLQSLQSVAEYLKENLPTNATIFLNGTLASGKTTLTKLIIKSFGLENDVTSPTFTLQNIYGDNLYHYDLYRTTLEEIANMGLLEEFDKEGWHIVEWGDERLKSLLQNAGYNTFTVNITILDKSREYTICTP